MFTTFKSCVCAPRSFSSGHRFLEILITSGFVRKRRDQKEIFSKKNSLMFFLNGGVLLDTYERAQIRMVRDSGLNNFVLLERC